MAGKFIRAAQIARAYQERKNAAAQAAAAASKADSGRITAVETDTPVAMTDSSGKKLEGVATYTKQGGYLASDGKHYTRPYTNYDDDTDSGADKALLSAGGYAAVQQYKSDWNTAKAQYDAAVAAGDTAAAERAQSAMTAANTAANAIRAKAGYSGGSNGGAYNILVSDSEQAAGAYTGSGRRYPSTGTASTSSTTESYLKGLYQAQIDANLAALAGAYEQNVNTLDAAADTLPAQYEAARNQAAGAAAVSARSFDRYAAATGLSSGAGAQARLADRVALQNDLNSVNTAEADALAQLKLRRVQLATEYENAVAQAKADGSYELARALYDESVRVSEALQEQENYLAELALKQAQFSAQLEQTGYENRLEQAKWGAQLAQTDYENRLEQAQLAQKWAQTQAEQAQKQAQEQQQQAQKQEQQAQARADLDYDRGLKLAQLLYNATGDASGFSAYGFTAAQIAALETQWKRASEPS